MLQQPPTPAPVLPEPSVSPATEATQQFTGHPVTFDFQGADLRAVLRTFAEISGLNIVIDSTIQGTVDVALRDVPWDQALDIILRANKLGYSVDGTIVRPFAVLRYEHDWLAGESEDHRLTASFASVPAAGSWTVFGQNRGRETLLGRLGVVGEINPNVALFGAVGGQWSNNGSAWSGGGGFRVVF